MIEYTVRVYDSGNRYWLIDGKYHREDGPAVEYANGNKEWYYLGVKCKESDVMGKELTVAEIEALLGYRVKIVK